MGAGAGAVAVYSTPGAVAILTPLGRQLVECYRAIEADAQVAARGHLHDSKAASKGTKTPRAQTSLKRSLRASAARR
jgi:molybdenum-dependent DNA-binding transcriptional regulator ModE